ncbi:serine/threonine-protein kinase pkn5-like isoform X1 [Actinia tenebrosa]|uniref:Serine/threonine-protein kinase pkn5-like isoform X1 n=1 Tax=Actinia tenebrosa TaxID=6105 RepID=A0A6P8HAH3_ACTTE|nr:serine/threonine-protein kinase pkn5-like isoform X1 [Actinia tenebrosa]
MSYLHEKEVIHQDLKPANIIVEDGSRKPIICDFGVSKLKDLAVTNMAGSNAGTLGYQHIEQLHGEKATTAVDVYSFGVITGEVYSRQPAWTGKTFVEVKKAIEKEEYPTFPRIPQEYKDLMAKCFKPAKQRATFMELLPDLESLSKIDVW